MVEELMQVVNKEKALPKKCGWSFFKNDLNQRIIQDLKKFWRSVWLSAINLENQTEI